MSAKHAILGLVIVQPSYAWRIAREVRRQLRFADLADSYPYWALEKLKEEGLVRQVDESGVRAGKQGSGRQTIYEATVKGIQAFEDWLRSTPKECSLREDVLYKCAVARPEDVPHIVEMIRDKELACVAYEQTLDHARSAGPKNRSDWNGALDEVVSEAERMFWSGRIDWFKGVREMLEAMLNEPRKAWTA